MTRGRRWLACAALLIATHLHAQEQTGKPVTPATRVLLIGNSLIYTNNLPGLLRSLARAQADGTRIDTETYVTPGAELADHWKQGLAQRALENGHWDVLVLQERGGLLACLESPSRKDEADCRNSVRTHRRFARLAEAKGIRVLLLGTWGPDSDWQDRLDRGLRRIAREIRATPVFAGTRLRERASRTTASTLFTDESLHPSLAASLIVTAMLYREITGRSPQARPLLMDFPLLPPGSRMVDNLPLERNEALNALTRPVTLAASELPALLEAAEPPP